MSEEGELKEKPKVIVTARGSSLTWSKEPVQITKVFRYENDPNREYVISGEGTLKNPFSLLVGEDVFDYVKIIYDYGEQESRFEEDEDKKIFYIAHNDALFAFDFNKGKEPIMVDKPLAGHTTEELKDAIREKIFGSKAKFN